MLRNILAWAFLLIAAAIVGTATYVALFMYQPPTAQTQLVYRDRPVLDGISDYPVSMELLSKVGDVSIAHKVTYHFDKEQYVYEYTLKNEGTSTVLFNWAVLDRLHGQGYFLELDAGTTEVITVESDERPTFYHGHVNFFMKDGKKWTLMPASRHAGPLPPSMADYVVPYGAEQLQK